jgi:SAM-dependent methyltransferase
VPPWLDRPVSRDYGSGRGTPVDRFYIERFLDRHRADIHGDVLEMKDDAYTRRFGHDLGRCSVLDIDARNPRADFVADLSAADAIPDATFDCFILTQTLQFVSNLRAAIAHSRRILRPGGTLLVTLPALSQPSPPQVDLWRFLPDGTQLLFAEAFANDAPVQVEAHGSLAAAVAFLRGVVREEVGDARLLPVDPQFPLIVSVRAVRTNPR